MTPETSINSILNLSDRPFNKLTEKEQKQKIVCAVLELIKAEVSASGTDQMLAFHMQSLENYVDKVAKQLLVSTTD